MFHIKIKGLFFSVLLVVILLPGVVPAQAQTQPPQTPPAPGLSEDDWSQIAAIQPEVVVSYQQQAYIKASNSEADDIFSSSIALYGDTLVVGSPEEDSSSTGVNGVQNNNLAEESGAVYVFVRNGNTWSQQAYLKASNTDAKDRFGSAVAIFGDTIVVGAPWEASSARSVNGDQADNSVPLAGAAYVFTRTGSVWSQQAYLKASNADLYDGFGAAVAISGNTITVGAPYEDGGSQGLNGDPSDNSAPGSGAAYIFTRVGSTWSQRAYLKSSDSFGEDDYYGDWFGSSIAMSGNTIVIGALWSRYTHGAAYVFAGSGSTWTEQAKLQPFPTLSDYDDYFGQYVAISGDTIVVGAPGEASKHIAPRHQSSDNSTFYAGAAYVFVRSGTTWQFQTMLKASNTETKDSFSSVGIYGNTIVVGAVGEDSNAKGSNGDQTNNAATDAGAVYVFKRNGTQWAQKAYLKASNTGASDNFGGNVAIFGGTVVVGAIGEDSKAKIINGGQADNSASAAGAAYVFLSAP